MLWLNRSSKSAYSLLYSTELPSWEKSGKYHEWSYENLYGAPNGPKIKYISWLHFIWLLDFTRHKYCLSTLNTDKKNSVDDTQLGRWHKTRSITQSSVDNTKLGRWHNSRSMAENSVDGTNSVVGTNSVDGTKLGRWHKTRSKTQLSVDDKNWVDGTNSVDGTKLGRWHKTRSMAQNSVGGRKLGRWQITRSMTQNSVDDTKLKAGSGGENN